MEDAAPKRKRQRPSKSPDGEDKRRGRPRVEKQDESAADRRRTQIRMAQRAYRQRKESTLEELRKRVSDLGNTIELMNKAFLDCRDSLYSSSLSQDQMLDLHQVTLQFETFVKDARNPVEETTSGSLNSGSTPPKAPESTQEAVTQPEVAPEPKNVPAWLDQSVVAATSKPKQRGPMEVGMGYTMYLPDGEQQQTESMDYFNFDTNGHEIVPLPQDQQQTKPSSFDVFNADVPESLPVIAGLSPPITYSFQETTFARRLHRACAESAYQFLSSPTRRPAEIERIFRLSLMGRDRAKLIAALKMVIARGPHEDLDFWQAPLIHVGGAGTHYPRHDPFGNLMPKKVAHNLGLIGPQTLALLENAAQENISTDMTVEIAGFEGEWFDPYDVQGYLEEKGIFIDPTQSFAEAEIVEMMPTPDSASTISIPHTPADTANGFEKASALSVGQIRRLSDTDADLSRWNQFTNMQLTAVGFSDAQMGSWNFLQPGEAVKQHNETLQVDAPLTLGGGPIPPMRNEWEDVTRSLAQQQPSPPRRKSIIIDINKLVEVMKISAVCLGRTPGFRRRDVDRAIALSSFDAF